MLQGWTQKGRRCTHLECPERQWQRSERHLLSLVDIIATVNCIFSPYNCSGAVELGNIKIVPLNILSSPEELLVATMLYFIVGPQ